MSGYGGMKGSDALKKLREEQGKKKKPKADTRSSEDPTPKMIEEYRASMEKLEKLLKYDKDIIRDFGDQGNNIIRQAYKLMRPAMDKLMFEKRKTGVKSEHCGMVHKALDVIVDALVYRSITPMVRDMGIEFQRLAFNWNQQLLGDKSLRNKTQYLHRLALGYLTMLETIDTSKALLTKLRDVFQRQPPAFDYSRHFREVLEDELSES